MNMCEMYNCHFPIFRFANFHIWIGRKNKRFIRLWRLYVKVVNYFCAKISFAFNKSALAFHYEKTKYG